MSNLTFTISAAPESPFPEVAAMDIMAQRHKTLDPSDLGTTPDSVSIISQPSVGEVKLLDGGLLWVNLDGAAATAGSTSFTFRAMHGATPTDCVVDVNIIASSQAQGWGEMANFFHPVDDTTGKWNLLKSEGHKDWYVDDSATGWTMAEILGDGGPTTGAGLISAHPDYGSITKPLALDSAIELHSALPNNNNSTFHLKRGGDYTTLQERFGKYGLSAMYLSAVTSYSTGDRPIIRTRSDNLLEGSFYLREEVEITGSHKTNQSGTCIAFNKIYSANGGEFSIKKTPHFTMMNSHIRNVDKTVPGDSRTTWEDHHSDRNSGIYLADSWHSCLYWNYFHHNGWGDGYDENGDGAYPQPPSNRSHNMYTQGDLQNGVMWGNISSQAASQGWQWRSGGLDAYNWGFANPMMGNLLGQGDPGKTEGNGPFSLSYRTVATQGFEHYGVTELAALYGKADDVGKQQTGLNYAAFSQSMYQSMVVHNSDPNDGTDTNTPKTFGFQRNYNDIPTGRDPYHPGSTWLVYRWREPDTDNDGGPIPDNSSGINTSTMNGYTLQLYTDQLRGVSAGTSEGFAPTVTYLTALEDFRGVAEGFCDYMIGGASDAGLSDFDTASVRTVAQTVKATPEPNGLTSGKWWVIPLDWNTEDYPGFVDNDSADLQGLFFWISVPKAIILDDLILGVNGGVKVGSSSVQVTGTLSAETAGSIGTQTSGRLLFNGYSGSEQITATVEGGLLANEGDIAGNMDITLSPQETYYPALPFNHGYAMLAKGGQSCTFGSGDTLTIKGFTTAALDGASGTATVTFDTGSTLRFESYGNGNVNNTYGMGVIKEFGTGLVTAATAPVITSVVDITNATLEIDVTGLAAGDYVLINVDTLTGSPSPTITGGSGSVSYATPGQMILTVT